MKQALPNSGSADRYQQPEQRKHLRSIARDDRATEAADSGRPLCRVGKAVLRKRMWSEFSRPASTLFLVGEAFAGRRDHGRGLKAFLCLIFSPQSELAAAPEGFLILKGKSWTPILTRAESRGRVKLPDARAPDAHSRRCGAGGYRRTGSVSRAGAGAGSRVLGSEGRKVRPSLRNIYKEIAREFVPMFTV